MVYLVKKKINGQIYLYLVESARVNGKAKWVWQKYLGPEKQIKATASQAGAANFTVTTYDFGLPVALMRVAEKLDLIGTIDRSTGKRDQGLSVGQYAAIATLNRCIKPLSKSRVLGWFETTYLQKFFPPVATYLDAMAYANHFEYLTEAAIGQVQAALNEKLRAEYGVDMGELVYDPTNFYTYINPAEDDALPQHGHPKDGRRTLRLVGLALLCTQDGGIPLLYDVYSGNVQDAALFKTELPKVIARVGCLEQQAKEVVLSFDKGNNSPDAFSQIDSAGLTFVASVRPSMAKDLAVVPASQFPMKVLPNGKQVGVLEYQREFYGRSRRLVVVYNPEQAKWNGENLSKKLAKEVATVHAYFEKRLNTKKWRTVDAVRKKIEKLIPKKGHWQFLQCEVKEEGGKVACTLKIDEETLATHVATLGKSYLITNHPTKAAEDVVWLFRQQVTVERAFSYLKSPDLLRARPIFHRKNASIRGHLFTCALGLLLLTVLAREVRKIRPEWSLEHVVELLSQVCVSAIKFEGTGKPVKRLNTMSPEAEDLAKILDLASAI